MVSGDFIDDIQAFFHRLSGTSREHSSSIRTSMESALEDGHKSLPSSTQFIDRLISQLASCKPEVRDPGDGMDHPTIRPQRHTSTSQSPFSSLPEAQLSQVKSVMLTLHCFFPNELLLALDILDRGLVRRFTRDEHVGQASACSQLDGTDPRNTERPQEDMFYVISTSAAAPTSPSRAPRTRIEQKGYEVRLHAWNCTCPTFTLNTFRDPGPAHSSQFDGEAEDETLDEQSAASDDPTCHYVFGGLLTRGPSRLAPPVCKHLLACLLMVRCPGIFSGGSRGQAGPVFLTREELAARCAGWGG